MEWDKTKKIDWAYIFTIPNILSYLRILLIPLMVVFFILGYSDGGTANPFVITSAACLLVSGLTDFFDGFIARKLNQITDLGKMLDPVADKLTLFGVGICIIVIEPLVIPVIAILILKDVLMLIGGVYMLKCGAKPFAAKWYGKIGTFLFYITVGSIVLFYMLLDLRAQFWIFAIILLTLTAVVMIYSLIRYFLIFKKMMKEVKAKKEID